MPKQTTKTTPVKKATPKKATTKIAAKAIKPANVKGPKTNIDDPLCVGCDRLNKATL